ncbi:hypothetical protein F4703DRAFT_1518311 [Phycomyces blakesleeanus]
MFKRSKKKNPKKIGLLPTISHFSSYSSFSCSHFLLFPQPLPLPPPPPKAFFVKYPIHNSLTKKLYSCVAIFELFFILFIYSFDYLVICLYYNKNSIYLFSLSKRKSVQVLSNQL